MVRLYSPVTEPATDIFVRLTEKEGKIHAEAVTKDGKWIKHLFELDESGITLIGSAGGTGIAVDDSGKIAVNWEGGVV